MKTFIEINGVKILTGHYYHEYTKEELALLPPVPRESSFYFLNYDGKSWWFNDFEDNPPGFGEEWWEDGKIGGKLKDFDYKTKEFKR